MATTKITDLTAYTDPVNTDVLPIVDVTSDVTKKVSIANVMKNASLGTAAAPGISFDGDPNTGIYSPGADQVAISTGGSRRLLVSNGQIQADTLFSIAMGGAGYQTIFRNGVDESNFITHGAVGATIFRNHNGSEFMRLDASGRLGVGTSSPQAQLQVLDRIKISDSTQAQGSLQLGDGASTSFNVGIARWNGSTNAAGAGGLGYFSQGTANSGGHYFYTGDAAAGSQTPRMVILPGGNVGIGTNSPGATFHVNGGSASRTGYFVSTDTSAYSPTSYSQYHRLYLQGGAATNAYNGIGFTNGSNSEGFIGFVQNASGYGDFVVQSYTGSYGEKLRVTSAGNVGIGSTTPRALLDVGGSTAFNAGTYQAPKFAVSNGYISIKSDAADGVSRLTLIGDSTTGDATIDWGGNANANLIFSNNGSNRARIDSSGRLLVGTSTTNGGSDAFIQVRGNSSGSNFEGKINLSTGTATNSIVNDTTLGSIQFGNNSTIASAALIECKGDAQWGTNDYPTKLVFSTTADGASSPTERMRIKETGHAKFSNTGSYRSVNTGNHEFLNSLNTVGLEIYNTNASLTNTVLQISADRNTTNGTYNLIQASRIGVSDCFRVLDSGNVQNTNNSYTGISDVKLKENIVDANSQWGDIKSLKVRKFNFKEETGNSTHTQIGLIAQEVEQVSPKLVLDIADRDAEGNDLGTVTKSVNYSVLYMKAVKALQEAMERIEQLEAEMAEVKAQLS